MPHYAKRKKQARTLARMLETSYTQALRILDGPQQDIRARVRDAEFRRCHEEELGATAGRPVGVITHPALPAPWVEPVTTTVLPDGTHIAHLIGNAGSGKLLYSTQLSYRYDHYGPVKAWLATGDTRQGMDVAANLRFTLKRFVMSSPGYHERASLRGDAHVNAMRGMDNAPLEPVSVLLDGAFVPAQRVHAQDWDAAAAADTGAGTGWEAVDIPCDGGGYLLYCGPAGSYETVRFGLRTRPEPGPKGSVVLVHDAARVLDEQILRFGYPIGAVRRGSAATLETRPGGRPGGVDRIRLRFGGECGRDGACVVLTMRPVTLPLIRKDTVRMLSEMIMCPPPPASDEAIQEYADVRSAIAAAPEEPVRILLAGETVPATRIRARGAEALEIPYGDGFIVYCGLADGSDPVRLELAWSSAELGPQREHEA